MINIAKLLKDVPEGTKLYSPLFGEVKFKYINGSKFGIVVEDAEECYRSFDKYGRYFTIYNNAECLLFPSKDYRTWQGWTPCVKPKFKVGDWVVRKDGETFYGGNYAEQITLIEVDEKGKYIWLPSKTWVSDDVIRPWTIADARDGDVLSIDFNGFQKIVIFKSLSNKGVEGYGITAFKDRVDFPTSYGKEYYSKTWTKTLTPATKEQRIRLFTELEKAGYKWDAEKKELRKIQHYDIANFKAGMPVLVRERDDFVWKYVLYSHRNLFIDRQFNAAGLHWKQCIPYEGNEHLLGTTDMCPEEYINW